MNTRTWLAAEPFTLTLSSGFFSFFAHCGVISVLEREGLMPHRITGSSAGALIGGLVASGTPASEISERLLRLKRTEFWDPAVGLGLLKGNLFRNELRKLASCETLESCPIPLAISTFDVSSRKTVVVTSGDLATVVSASCAFPGLFQPVRIDGRLVSDGGIADRPGLAGVANGDRTFFHHISSRSPWRRFHPSSMEVPIRENMRTFSVPNLPRVTPFSLQRGRECYDAAVTYTERELSLVAAA